ncbi:MAG: squalene/phytoene synthase family protein [Bdellovibrionales bacterium]|nr:squalene/phytoene synthase family protein [Bdellovibrionales bacterium]
MMETEFYQGHLDRVSRSFAYCISQLDAPLRGWVSLTYLICRILDTVEDAPWKRLSEQLRQFGQFDEFLLNPPPPELVRSWNQQFPQEIPEGEKILLRDSALVFGELHGTPLTVRAVIQEMIVCMSAGMQHYSRLRKQRGQVRLINLREVNQYCFFVAGIVGETLAQLVRHVEPQVRAARKFVLEAHHFGLFLQKINLLKDQFKDEQEGRFFIHSREEIKESLNRNSLGAWRFLESLPIQQRGFRLFCAQSLFLGLASLPWVEKSHSKGKKVKIPRLATMKLFDVLKRNINDNLFLEGLFGELAKEAGLKPDFSASGKISSAKASFLLSDGDWLCGVYRGQLHSEDFFDLGMAGACLT